MNKKRLSVVMAGAMLATSVAPVLAAEVQKSEHSANELGLLQKEMRELLNSKTFTRDSKNNPGNGLEDLRGKSVYAIYVNGRDTGLEAGDSQDKFQKVFNDLGAGSKIEIFNKGFKEVDGKVYGYEYTEATAKKYTKTELDALEEEINKKVYDATQPLNKWGVYSNLIKENGAKYDATTGRLTIEFVGDVTLNGENFNTIVFDENTTKKDLDNYYIDDNQDQTAPITENTTPGDFFGFKESDDKVPAGYKDIASSLEREITITEGGYDFNIGDLYDGLMLTTKGHDFFTLIKEARSMGRDVVIKGNYNKLVISENGVVRNDVKDAIKLYKEKGKFTITFGAKGKLAEETYTVTGDNEANLERLATWMIKPLARVDVLAGETRYETAVTIAKEYANLTSKTVTGTNVTGDVNIVLVNGDALVDGLAAAPLAASKYNTVNGKQKAAPVLLTEADALPKATKAYLKEILAEVKIGHLDDVTINLVGGESVLSRSLERELKGLGFKVERFGGDNREETSLEVAKEVDNDYNRAFVVGADGEADAMSIAAVASELKTPIIVSKPGGISEEALYELKNQYVTVIGGEKAVSSTDYNAIKAEAEGITRVFGDNRQKTNAEIIKKYYKKASAVEGFVGPAENVIVAKDGTKRRLDLVDALAAANMASAKNAPIVLATDSLSKEQENALELNAVETKALYQVGLGVDKEKVVRIIAQNLGLSNR